MDSVCARSTRAPYAQPVMLMISAITIGLDDVDALVLDHPAEAAQAFAALDGPLGNYVRDAIKGAGLYVHPKMWENGMRQITSPARMGVVLTSKTPSIISAQPK